MWPATRVRGMTLAVATLAIAVALEQIVLASPAMSGGAAGSATPRLELLGWNLGVDATGADNFRPQFVALCLALTVIAAVSVASLRRSRVGLRWLAVRSNERAAAAAGINVTAAKLGAVAVSSALAGLAGVLTAYSVTRLSPTSFMVAGALATVALTYLAGVSSISGAVLAGIIAPAGLLTVLGGAEGERTSMAVSGIALIAAAIFAPAGLTGLGRSAWHRLRSPRPSRTAHPAAEPFA
jgi:ABC-type branched-subunit amino acid transport system permease subunit